MVVTCDGAWRRSSVVPLKTSVDEALRDTPTVSNVVVIQHVGDASEATMRPEARCLVARGRRGRLRQMCHRADGRRGHAFCLVHQRHHRQTKGIVHTSGGYLFGVSTAHRYVFDIKEDDVYWCTADIGWVTGHSYIVYGPLTNGATSLMYEGTPDFPDRDRFWSVIDKYGVNIFYTAPTAIRTFMRWGTELPARHSLSSLRLLGTVGEPINPEAWVWYNDYIGQRKCPSWIPGGNGNRHDPDFAAARTHFHQTRIGSHRFPALSLESSTPTARQSDPDRADIWSSNALAGHDAHHLGDPDRYVQRYWSRYPGMCSPVTAAKWSGTVTSGFSTTSITAEHHQPSLSTYEVEGALVDHSPSPKLPSGRTLDIKGQGVSAFVTLKKGITRAKPWKTTSSGTSSARSAPSRRPDEIFSFHELPRRAAPKSCAACCATLPGPCPSRHHDAADPVVVSRLKTRLQEEGSRWDQGIDFEFGGASAGPCPRGLPAGTVDDSVPATL